MDLTRIPVSPEPARRPLPAASELGFGRIFAERAFAADHDAERGWHEARIVPLSDLSVSVATGAVQYGLSIFEGLKGFRDAAGTIRLFRPDAHARRLRKSSERLSLPIMPEADFITAVKALARAEAACCPAHGAGSLYFRPTLWATETFLGVRPAKRHAFAVLASPVGAYFSGAGALRLWAERDQIRAAPGGLGAAKTGANYAASVLAAERAKARGFDQVLWLDARERRYLSEVGTMNVFVELDSGVVTPPLDDTILAGVTRDACLTLLRSWGIPALERPISLDDLRDADRAGKLRGIFGTGTAAVVSEVGEVAWEEGAVHPRGGTAASRLREALVAIQHGTAPDPHGWIVAI